MESLTIETSQIDMMIQEIWTKLSKQEQQAFLNEIWQVDQAYQREIETALQNHLSL